MRNRRLFGRFTLASVPGLVAWWEPPWSNDIPNGSNISRIQDISGNGNDALQTTEANQPGNLVSGINGIRCADFVAANNTALTVADAASIQNIFDGGGAVFGAVRLDAITSAFGAYIMAGGSNAWTLRGISDSTIRFTADFDTTDGIWQAGDDSIELGTPFIFGLTYDADSAANNPLLWVNGASVAFVEDTTPVGTRVSGAGSAKTIGNAAFGSRQFDGPIGTLALYDEIPSAADITRIFANLSERWDIDLA